MMDEPEQQVALEPPPAEPPIPALSSRFHFSLSRLMISIAAATLPLLMIRAGDWFGAGCYAVSSASLLVLFMLFRIEVIPWLNLAAIPVLSWAYIDRTPPLFSSADGSIQQFGLLAMWGVVYLVVQLSARQVCLHPGNIPCIWILYTAAIPLAFFNAAVIWFVIETASWGGSRELNAGYWLRFVLGLTTVFNLYWAATDRGATLQERPGLAICYEATSFLIPYAALLICFRWY